MVDDTWASVFLSRRFQEFSSRAQVNKNVRDLATALKTICSEVGVELVDLEDGTATVQSAYERSKAAAASCDLLIVFLGYSFSKLVRDEVDIALARGMGLLAYRLPDIDPVTGNHLEVEDAQREFVESLNGLDRAVIGQLPVTIYNKEFALQAFEFARDKIRPELLRALAPAPLSAVKAWGLVDEGAGRCAVVEPAERVLHAAPIGSDGLVDATRSRDLVHHPDITPTTPGAVLPSGELVHGTSWAVVLHRPTRDGYTSTEIAMDEPGEVIGAWGQMQQVLLAWASPSGTRLVRLSRSRGDVLAADQIASQRLQRVIGFGAGWIGVTSDGKLTTGPGVPSQVGRLHTQVAGCWVDVCGGIAGGAPVLIGLVDALEEHHGTAELVAVSIRSAGSLEVYSTVLDGAAQRVFAGAPVDPKSSELNVHVLHANGRWRMDRLIAGGPTASPRLAWREVQFAL